MHAPVYPCVCHRAHSLLNLPPGACRAPFVADLLKRGLGLQQPQVRIGSGSEAWTLGAALAQGSAARLADPLIDAAFQPPAPAWVQALWGLLLAGCLLWLAWLIWCRICIGMGRPPTPWSSTPLDALHVPRCAASPCRCHLPIWHAECEPLTSADIRNSRGN